jgi:AraC-like DNA-binding protein
MLRETTATRFLAAPRDCYVRGPNWIQFCAQEVAGCVLWGALEGEAIRTVLQLAAATHRRGSAPRVGIIDARDVTAVSPAALTHYQAYLRRHARDLASTVRRCAIVRPRPLALAALSEGLVRVLVVPHEVSLFPDVVACADWLGEPRIASLVDDVRATRTGLDESATARMKPLFVERLRFVSIEDAAVALGMSPRSLQRQLKAEGTTFQRELDCARVEAAMRAMRETNGSLTRIADEVGCASVSHLTVLFRRVVGKPPSRWRQEEQMAPPTVVASNRSSEAAMKKSVVVSPASEPR